MRKSRLRISAGAALLLAALYFFLDYGTMAAIIISAAVHELGHAAALRAMRARITELRIGLDGLCITYTGRMGYGGQFLSAAAGPAAGAALALGAAWLGVKFESGFLYSCAGVSAVLSAFNLLPALPLDGGRMLYAACCFFRDLPSADRITLAASLLSGAALLAAGLYFILAGKGAALEIAAVWLLLAQPGIVKNTGVL